METETERKEHDWTKLPDDIVISLFSCLINRDRASLSSTCKTWWTLSKSQFLWQELDLRFYKCDAEAAKSLASRCCNLKKLRLRGHETAASVINLEANNLREISIEYCSGITDVTLAVLVARHKVLECLQLGPDSCKYISIAAIKDIALSCPNLKKLRLSGIEDVNGEAIDALAVNCQNLNDVGFLDCGKVDEVALGNVRTLGFFSVAGTKHINWNLARLHWSNLLNLVCLDVSRTNIEPRVVSDLLQSCFSLKLMCALSCPLLEQNSTSIKCRGKSLLMFFPDILKELTTLFIDIPKDKGNVFLDWRNSNNLKDSKLEGVLDWLEGTICNSLSRFLYYNPHGPDKFWFQQGTVMLLSFLESPHEEVQETAAKAFASFTVTEDESVIVPQDVIRILIHLARSPQEGLQAEAVKAISNLVCNKTTAKVVVDEGGVEVLINIARSTTKKPLADALNGLCSISCQGHQSAFANTGGIRALVDIIVKWSKPVDSERIMERVTAVMANLAVDEKCSMEINSLGGVQALVKVLKNGIAKGVREKGVIDSAARALSNLAYYAETAMCIIDEDGIPLLTHLCSSSVSKMSGFMSALSLANMFDARLDELIMIGSLSESTSNRARLKIARRTASKAIQAFLKSCPNLQAFSADASSSSPASESKALTRAIQLVRIQEAVHLIYSESCIGRVLTMLSHSSPFVMSCGAFALLQFTLPGGKNALHHANLLRKAGAQQMLLLTEASESALPEAKVFASIVLRNLKCYHVDPSN